MARVLESSKGGLEARGFVQNANPALAVYVAAGQRCLCGSRANLWPMPAPSRPICERCLEHGDRQRSRG